MNLPHIGVSLPHVGPYAGLEAVVAVGADEMHIALHLLPAPADQQVELLEALAAKLGLPAL
ncbi:hypothetical protein OIE66_19260 [Nonomuraea sp. NBC_01738]|uniref:hypothetical protein n=1 Tax=Nonomuraea sp. NBC_01738 TaxID=2976003 RepID=UPI002E12900F|nr:hypothetical protein OIE66_19260 [Nonomuraea sp. NBC_01738]